MKRLLITGSRYGWNPDELESVLREAIDFLGTLEVTLVHGDAPGVDTQAKELFEKWGLPHEPHPAQWKVHGKAAGPIRNQEMVDSGADLCIAFPAPDSRGTRDCLRRAKEASIPTETFFQRQAVA